MKIRLSRKGDLQILSVKGKIHLQNWRVLDKHLATLHAKGFRWFALDLSGVTLICSTGVGSILDNVRKLESAEGGLLLVASGAYMQDILKTFGYEAFRGRSYFTDWPALEARLRSLGVAVAA